MAELPVISIIVPNLNSGDTLERALQSLLDQQYPKLEILVADGGSTDRSVEIIRRFEPHLTWWISEKDRGQSDAINKGFSHATGEIVNWLCSDDYLAPGALHAVARHFLGNDPPDVVAGACRLICSDPPLDEVRPPSERAFNMMPIAGVDFSPICQQSCFYRRSLLDRKEPIDVNLHYAMDFELWNYFKSKGARWKFVPELLATFDQQPGSKTIVGGEKLVDELEIIYRRYAHERIFLSTWHRKLRYPLERLRRRHPGWLFGLVYYPWQCGVIAMLSPFYGFRRVRWMNWVFPWLNREPR